MLNEARMDGGYLQFTALNSYKTTHQASGAQGERESSRRTN